jgi:hypothetical protein
VFSDDTGSSVSCLCISVLEDVKILYLSLHIKVIISHTLGCFYSFLFGIGSVQAVLYIVFLFMFQLQ